MSSTASCTWVEGHIKYEYQGLPVLFQYGSFCMTDCSTVAAVLLLIHRQLQLCRDSYLLVAHAGEEERMDKRLGVTD